ncbi:hypothetical protein [Burkholderia seminalis]|uniref:hypothetical protein n=1 Tax=Burkholderia seminalis TaxID=488731 RepID=UPI00075CA7C8|nr:hypothetical protein [Burkholderia seminalis]
MKRAAEIADLVLKVLSCIAILGAGGWALLNFGVGGSTEWQANIAVDAQVLPYHDEFRLLVVHVKTKNPRPTKFELTSARHDSYLLHVRRLPDDGPVKTVYPEATGDGWIEPIDLLARAGGDYEFLPAAEMDDVQTIVVPAGANIVLTAIMMRDLGTLDEHGKRDTDSISASTVVHIPK